MLKTLISLFLLGLSFGAGPCLASCGPLFISYVAGTHKNVIKSAGTYILFSSSRILVYIGFGLLIFFSSRALSAYNFALLPRLLLLTGALFIIIIGLLIMSGVNVHYKAFQKLQSFFLKKDVKTTVILGFVMAVLPCAPLISVITYIGLISKHWLDSVIFSLAFGIGTAVSPLFILAVFAGLIPRIIKEKEVFYRIFNFICGLVIIFLGLQLVRRAF